MKDLPGYAQAYIIGCCFWFLVSLVTQGFVEALELGLIYWWLFVTGKIIGILIRDKKL